ncbi:MAG: L-rhamnose mutarotase [Jejuia sp.]
MLVNTYRRFTYFLNSKSDKLSDIFTSEVFQNLQSEVGIHDLNVYQKDNDRFIVIDADKSLNSEKLINVIKNQRIFEGFNTLLSQLEALERIYKLDQKAIYAPNEGQLKNSVEPSKRFVWTLLLEPELIDEYKRVHAMGMAWPEITANMKSVGVKDMEIYIHNTQVMLIMDTIPDFDLDEVGPKWQKLPREEEWQAYVAKFQKTDPESSIQEKWQDMIKL